MNLTYSCKACRFWSSFEDNPLEGECRRKSPNPAMGSDGNLSAIFPVTAYNDFCGEQVLDEEKISLDCVVNEELKIFIEEKLETQVIEMRLDRGDEGEYVIGEIIISTDPDQDDIEKVAMFLSERYQQVDISMSKG